MQTGSKLLFIWLRQRTTYRFSKTIMVFSICAILTALRSSRPKKKKLFSNLFFKWFLEYLSWLCMAFLSGHVHCYTVDGWSKNCSRTSKTVFKKQTNTTTCIIKESLAAEKGRCRTVPRTSHNLAYWASIFLYFTSIKIHGRLWKLLWISQSHVSY